MQERKTYNGNQSVNQTAATTTKARTAVLCVKKNVCYRNSGLFFFKALGLHKNKNKKNFRQSFVGLNCHRCGL